MCCHGISSLSLSPLFHPPKAERIKPKKTKSPLYLCFRTVVVYEVLKIDSANCIILNDCYIYIHLQIKLVSREYPHNCSDYVNLSIFKHVSLLVLFSPFLELRRSCWKSWWDLGQLSKCFLYLRTNRDNMGGRLG